MTIYSCRFLPTIGVVALVLSVGCRVEVKTTPPAPKAAGSPAAPAASPTKQTGKPSTPPNFKLTTTAFQDGEPIPKKYAGEGDDISPPFAWEGVPEGTQEFAFICDDPDARSREPWVHWVIYGIAADVSALPENLKSNVSELKEPLAAKQGENFFDEGNTIGWRGPMPPQGRGTHHYHFKLYAIDKLLDVPPSATKKQVVEAMQGHIVGEAELIGTYER